MKEIRSQNAIRRNCENGYLWLYYSFCKEYARQPADLDDLLDGLACTRARHEIEAIYGEE